MRKLYRGGNPSDSNISMFKLRNDVLRSRRNRLLFFHVRRALIPYPTYVRNLFTVFRPIYSRFNLRRFYPEIPPVIRWLLSHKPRVWIVHGPSNDSIHIMMERPIPNARPDNRRFSGSWSRPRLNSMTPRWRHLPCGPFVKRRNGTDPIGDGHGISRMRGPASPARGFKTRTSNHRSDIRIKFK